MRSKVAMVLESRILFDGAMVATAIEADGVTDAPEIEAVEAIMAIEEVNDVAEEPVESTQGVVEPEGVAHTVADDAETAEAPASDASADDTEVFSEPVPATRNEVVFVDGRVNDPAAFASEGREVVVLSTEQDGMTQIASALSGRTGLSAIHIVSHGGDGYLSLGSGSVTAETIQSTNQASLQLIGQALAEDGDILIYACDYAAGESGLAAMELIADITGADVAASTDATGHESLGGDWTLEQSVGQVDTVALAPGDWIGGLDFTFTGAGTVGAVGMAENIMGAGVTVVGATYQGGATQSGTFTTGSGVTFGNNVLGFTSGTILSTGTSAAGVAGPNNNGGFGSNAPGVDGDAALNAMAGNSTFDAAILNISFIPDVPPGGSAGDVGRMTLEIVFGSEEYVEYVGQMNDVMEVTVNGTVVSLVPNSSGGESTIGINSVNTTQNPSLFINNTGATYNTQMDAFTVTIPMAFDVILGQTNTIRLAVADAVDTAYDSWMFVRADSGQTVVVAEDDEVTTAANLPITVDLTANDYSLAGGSMSLTHIQGQVVTQGQVITLGSGIQLTVGSGGQVTVTGNGSSAANDTFTYQVSNGMGGIASATVNVEVTAPNLNPPVAQDDVEAVLADATLSDSVLTDNGNGADTDPNGNPMSVLQVNLAGFTSGSPFALPSGALLTMNANGSYVYDPNGAFDGLADGATTTDSFSYTVTDGQGGNDTATVTITATGVASNHAPVAVDDSYLAGEEGATLLVNPMANDSDTDGDELALVFGSTTGSNGGSIGMDDSGNLVFVAGPSFDNLAVGQTRDTTFTYTLSDALGASDTATVTVTVQGANDAPNAQDDQYDVTEDGGHTLGSVLANDSDLDSAEIWADVNPTAGSNGGEFSQDDSGNLIFVPGSSFDSLAVGETRDTSFSYVLHDSDGGQSAATVTVTVQGVNDAPVGGADDFVASEDAAISLGLVTQNDADIDGGEVYADVSAVGAGDQGGFFSFDDSGSLIFNPEGDFEDLGVGETRDTRFVYTLFDGQGASSTATVTVTVLGANDAPMAEDDSFVAYEDWALALGSVSGNDSDADGDDVYVDMSGSVAGSTGGRFWVDDSGNLVFDPEGDFEDLGAGETRDTSFTYMAYDGLGGAGEANVTVTVTGINDNPVAGNDHYEASADAAVSLGSPLGNDTDAEGHDLVLEQTQVAAGSDGGQFSVDDGGSVSFNPAGAFDDLLVGATRDTSFTYTVIDSQGGVGSGTLTVTVHGVAVNPEEPVASTEGDDVVAGSEGLSYPNEIVFVDARVPEPEAFATHGRELVIISIEQDGVVQMANALAGRSGIEAIHIVSHGGEGTATLGLGDIHANNLESIQVSALQSMAQALTEDGDILVYACEFAGGESGLTALQMLSQYTQADVAASLFVTGDASLGGNWSLEATVGSVEASTIVPQDWAYLLDVPQAQPAVPVVAVSPVAQVPAEAIAPEVVEAPMVANGAPIQTPVVTPLMVAAMTPARETVAPVVLQEMALQAPNTVRVHDLETAMRDSLQAVLPVSSLELAVVELHGDASGIAATADAAPAWHVEHQEIWNASRQWLDELVLQDGEADGDEAEEPVRAAPGFRVQLNRFAQWGTGRPLTRAAARA